jgi:hypothetical protein
MRTCKLLFFALVLGSVAQAGATLSFESTELIPERHRAVLEPTLRAALGYLAELAPSRLNPMRSRVQRKVHIVLSTSADPEVENACNQTGMYGSDALTFTTEVGGELVTFIFLLVDRLVFDEEGKQRPDAFVRLLTALAHEFFGTVPSHLKLRLGKRDKTSAEQGRLDEIAAFETSVAFLERFSKSALSNGIPSEQIAQALEREKRSLQNWIEGTCSMRVQKPGGLNVYVFGGSPMGSIKAIKD